jgi:hypothetical protein
MCVYRRSAAPQCVILAAAMSIAPRRRRAVWTAVTALVFTTVALCGAEILLRGAGYAWRDTASSRHEPRIHAPDPVLGWKALPGTYVLPPYSPGAPPIRMTFDSDGARSTGPVSPEARRLLVFVGGSFTQGRAVSDADTFAWRVRSMRPELRVANYGTAGYGTYQSLLVLERLFAAPDRPDVVVYGFIDHHEIRNVAGARWLRMLARHNRTGGRGAPRCSLGTDGSLVRHPPSAYSSWPLRDQFAGIAALEFAWWSWRARTRERQKRQVTEALLLEMRDLVRRNGARFLVAPLSWQFDRTAPEHYRLFFQGHDFEVAPCARPLTPDMQVPGEGHPNRKMHARWARCIDRALGADP